MADSKFIHKATQAMIKELSKQIRRSPSVIANEEIIATGIQVILNCVFIVEQNTSADLMDPFKESILNHLHVSLYPQEIDNG